MALVPMTDAPRPALQHVFDPGSTFGSRVIEQSNGAVTVVEKPCGFIVGEQLANCAQYLVARVSKVAVWIHHQITFFPVAEARETTIEIDPDVIVTDTGYTIFHVTAFRGDLDGLKQLYAAYPKYLDWEADKGVLAIHQAAHGGHVDVVLWMAEQQPDLLHRQLENKMTVLTCFVMNNHFNAVQRLVNEAGLWPHYIDLAVAAKYGCLEILQFLDSLAPSGLNRDATPLSYAIEERHYHVVEWLIRRNPQLCRMKTGETPIIDFAREVGDPQILEMIHECIHDATVIDEEPIEIVQATR